MALICLAKLMNLGRYRIWEFLLSGTAYIRAPSTTWLPGQETSQRVPPSVCACACTRAFSAKYVWKMESLKQLLPVYTNHRVAQQYLCSSVYAHAAATQTYESKATCVPTTLPMQELDKFLGPQNGCGSAALSLHRRCARLAAAKRGPSQHGAARRRAPACARVKLTNRYTLVHIVLLTLYLSLVPLQSLRRIKVSFSQYTSIIF